MTREYFHFLNLEYWFCIIYSLFGGKCTYVGEDGTPLDASGAGGSFSGSGVEGATSSAAQASGGFFGAITDSFSVAGHAIWGVIGGPLSAAWSVYSTLAYSLSGILFLGLAGSLAGLALVRYRERAVYGHLPPEPPGSHRMGSRWQLLLDRAMSSDPKEWRESILAADGLLGEMLGNLGYAGEGTAEKIRSVPEGAFVTLPAAWEAHRVKNFVSSNASDFILTQREAFRVMKLYEQVFEEFKFV